MADVDITSLSVEISAESQGAELNINKLANAIANLRSKGNVSAVCDSLDKLAGSIAGLKSASKGIGSIFRNIEKMSNIDVSGIDFTGLSAKLESLKSELQPLQNLDASGLKAVGSAMNAIAKIPSINDKLDADTLNKFKTACDSISTSLTPLASQLDKVGNAFAKLPSQLSKVVTQANRVTAANERQRKSYLSLSNQMNGFMRNMVKLVSLKAIAEYLGNAVAKFNDFYEATDLFHNAMGNLSGEADTLISKMQGLLGVDPTKAMTYMATIQSLGTSFGLASDKAYVLSKNLTQLAYDEGSYWNKDVAETFTAMSSAIFGEIEPIRRLGIDLSQARLQQELLALGFNKQVSSLSQADKAVLRYIAIMKQTANVQGNLAQTIQSPANQIKILKAQLDMLAKSVGSLLYPALKSILPPLIAAVQLIREFVEWVAKLMGVKVVFTDFTKSADSVGSIGDAMDDTADSTKKAAKALKDYTMGFDELNIIDPTQGSSGSGGGASAGNILGDVDLSGYDMFKNYVGTSIDEMKQKIKSMLPLIESIAAAFALWELGKFIKQIGEVIKGMNGIQKAAAMIAILVVEWTLVQKFSDSFLKTGDVKAFFAEWLTTAAAAIGGYALFGAEGASLALIVSAVAQLESIKTNLSQGTAKATDASVWIQGISAAVTTGIAGAVFTKTATGFSLGLSVGAVLALSAITYGGTKGGSIKPGDSIDMLLTALTAAAGGLAGVTLALAAGASAPIAGAALILGVGVGVVLEQLGITFGKKDRIKDVEDYIKCYEDAGYTTLAIHYRLKNLGFSDNEINMAEQGIDSTFEIFRYTFNEKLEALNEWWSQKWEGFKKNIGKSWDSLKNFAANYWENNSLIHGLIEQTKQNIADLKETLGTIRKAFDQKVKDIEESAANAGRAAAEWVNGVLDKFRKKRDEFFNAGKNLIQGFIDGIKNLKEQAISSVTSIATSAVDKFKSLLGIHSPSTVFAEIGGYIDQGLANGITAAFPYVEQAMTNLANAVQQKGNEMIDYGADVANGFVDNMVNTFDAKWNEIDNGLKSDFIGTIKSMIDAVKKGDIQTVAENTAAIIWKAMGEENRKQVKSYASDLVSNLTSALKTVGSKAFSSAKLVGKNILDGITSKFGEISTQVVGLGSKIASSFSSLIGPISASGRAISIGLSSGVLSQFPSIIAGIAGLIGQIGAAFMGILQTIGSVLTSLGIPTGVIMIAGGVAIAAAIAGIVGTLVGKYATSSRPSVNDNYSSYPGTSDYDSANGSNTSSGSYYPSSSASGASPAELRSAVHDGCYNAFLDIFQRYGDELTGGKELKIYLDGKQITASVEKRQSERGFQIMGDEVYSY